MLELDSIEVAYGEAIAVRGVSLSVPKGSVVALIGSNGAGKTSLVKATMGMQPLKSGSIRLDGLDLREVSPSDRPKLGMALVPEGRRLFPQMNVIDNLLVGLHHPTARKNSRNGLDWVMELFPALRERTRQLAGTLSGGEQQMVALGRALISRPRLLILDEPSLGLAPVIVSRVFDIVEKISGEGVTILLAEQNMHKALSLSTYGYVMDDGCVTLHAPAHKLMDMPEVRAAYLGG